MIILAVRAVSSNDILLPVLAVRAVSDPDRQYCVLAVPPSCSIARRKYLRLLSVYVMLRVYWEY